MSKSKKTTTKTSKKNIRQSISPTKFGLLGFVSLFAVIGAAYVFASQAAPGSKNSVIQVDPVSSLVYGGKVRFTVSTRSTTNPWVMVQCYQNGTRVYSHTLGYFPYALGEGWFTMGPTTLWQSGGADCTAQLLNMDNGKFPGRVLATTNYTVQP